MTTFKKSLYAASMVALVSSQAVFALNESTTTRTFNPPVVSSVTSTTATVSLSDDTEKTLSPEEKALVYFEYYQTRQVCIMIYPTPEYCLPKKTEKGKTSVTLTDLKPGTSYTIAYKKENTIRCITTPCPENGFESKTVEFTTGTGTGTSSPVLTPSFREIFKDLWFGQRGADVTALQKFLIDNGFMKVSATGYFGALTKKAVKDFQKSNNISSTGYFGKLTRGAYKSHHNKGDERNENASRMKMSHEAWQASVNGPAETFEGVIQAYSTACFADGICSITVDGKTIVTTRGWSQDIVGSVTGVPDFGSIEGKIGSRAKVYAAKTVDGYTLYGNKDYYVEVK